MLQEELCPLAAWQTGLRRPRVYNTARALFWFGSQINHCLQCTRRNQTSPHPATDSGVLFGLQARREGILSLPGGLDTGVWPDCSASSPWVGKWNSLRSLAQTQRAARWNSPATPAAHTPAAESQRGRSWMRLSLSEPQFPKLICQRALRAPLVGGF